MSATVNRIGLAPADYRGSKTTLCAGCGHNAISERIIDACFELGIQPHQVIKLSGIGCSSKSPAYFLGRAFGFNAVHGRMPSVATGALLANRTLRAIGVSGDGDTASIGLGQFIHLMRRNLPLVYIIEDNGVYGLTKGQFSATADEGQRLKSGVVNQLPALDLCALAIQAGVTFAARSFSGDKRQLTQILKAALSHQGVAMLDIVSPCVTFNDQPESTKSYQYVKQHETAVQEVDFIPYFDDITVDYDPGTVTDVRLHDGSHLRLRKLERAYDPTDRRAALSLLSNAHGGEEVLTGIFFIAPDKPDFLTSLRLVPEPLATLPESRVRPPRAVLDQINASLA
ncbi:MAG: 2-oxoacid:ferredoxin oxidoreductase subunit beta [Terriglobales bacterium]